MKDYSETLNLPRTDFPMRARLPQREPDILDRWQKNNIYKKVLEKRRGQEKFILHDGPPYANGDIHMGTALNKVLKDIVNKYKLLKGYDVPYVPGWDTHGLPIEHQIIKTRKIRRHEISPLEFRRLCRDYALEYKDIQLKQFQRLGVWADWENPYLTLTPDFEAEQIRVFGRMAARGHIYKGLKPVYWCPRCETALAEAEIEYGQRRSPSIYVKFPVVEDKGLFSLKPAYCLIWTTTPWTIPANMAIALHPDYRYLLVRWGKEYILLAEELLEEVETLTGKGKGEVVASFTGKELEGVVCRHPLFDRRSPLILADYVALDQGTGCVHTAPGHGQEDYESGLKYNLPIFSPIDNKGVFTQEAGEFAGIYYEEGNKAVVEALEREGSLFFFDFIEHQYPHCWRCKKPVLFRATEQWFASIEGFRKEALEAVENVKWTPSWGKERMHNMIRDRQDWCISRQRVWGVPIPIFYCKQCGKHLLNEQTIEAVATLFAREGSDAWYIYEAEDILPPDVSCPHCGNKAFRKESDIMDVWFDSGSTHQAVLQQRDNLGWPADLYLEGSDQYRGWFQSSLLTSVAMKGLPPYKEVLSHGWVVDAEGKKMSKSLGNVILPEKVIKDYGADILRLWVSSADFTSDIHLSNDILKQLSEVYRKIRNTCRFLLGNLQDFDPETDQVPYQRLENLDRWALHRLARLAKNVEKAYENYEFHHLFYAIHHFSAVDMSSFYLDVVKDRLYCSLPWSQQRRGCQTVLYKILKALTVLMAPVLTFTAEEVWDYLPGDKEESVYLEPWPEDIVSFYDEDLEKKWKPFLELREEVMRALEKARQEKLIGSSLQAELILYLPQQWREQLADFNDDLAELFIVSGCIVQEAEKMQGEKRERLETGLNIKDIYIEVKPARGEKCPRCWMISEEIEGEVCPRCSPVVKELLSR